MRKTVNYDRFLRVTMKHYMPILERTLDTPRGMYKFFASYVGKKGPVTFTGTPKEVIEKLRSYQKGF